MRNKTENNRRTADARVWLALLGGIAGFLLAGRLAAHDTWILPNRPRVVPGQPVTFDLTSGMAFPANEVGVKPDRLARASARLREMVSDLGREVSGKKSLRLKTRFPRPGIAAVWVESKPRALELKPAEVKEYLEEIGAWDSVGRKWESEGKGKWRESYTKHAKTYVRVGRPESDDSWSQPVGMDLELVPESDPTQLAAGQEIAIRLLENGQPAADLAVGLVAANAKSGSLSKTDSEGRVRLRFDHGGWWLVRATVLKPSEKPDLDWESRFATLTLSVGAR
ncbi:MAG TPA: DUF4198 domain-containing protein [Thermoanaerobaculia bacterium]|nr:DUF4198 domain-containing protein [Thermoanaerobaculia bacterium]